MARSFNGTSDFILTPKSIAGYGIASAFTLHTWFWESPGGTMFLLGDNDSGFGLPGIEMNIATSGTTTFNVRMSNSSNSAVSAGGGTVIASAWNTLAGTYDGANLKAWGNGSFITSTAQTGPVLSTGRGLYLGQRGNLGSFWNGRLAETALWSVPLSAVEIMALYAGVRASQIRPGSLRAYWPLDGYGHPALDRSGHAFNGALTGTTFVPGPQLISAAPIQISTLKFSASSSGSAVFRRTLSPIGRTRSRQAIIS